VEHGHSKRGTYAYDALAHATSGVFDVRFVLDVGVTIAATLLA
jgi:hypothetical protein